MYHQSLQESIYLTKKHSLIFSCFKGSCKKPHKLHDKFLPHKVRWFPKSTNKTICFLISPSGVLHHIVIKYGTSQYPNRTVLCCHIFVLTEEGQTCHLPHPVWSAENDDSKCTKNMFQDFVLLFKFDWTKSYHSGIMLPKKQICQFIKNVSLLNETTSNINMTGQRSEKNGRKTPMFLAVDLDHWTPETPKRTVRVPSATHE